MPTRNQKIQKESIPFRQEEHQAKDTHDEDQNGTEKKETLTLRITKNKEKSIEKQQ